MHPELADADRDIIRATASSLMLGRLLVAPNVDEARTVKDLGGIAQHVLAHLV